MEKYKKKILLVDDDIELTDIVSKYFSQYEFEVSVVHDGLDLENIIRDVKPDLILLDVMLPSKSGFDLLKDLQSDYDIPIIMLTAKGEEVDKVIGLEMGADDYVTKPFSVRELIARIRTVLKRATAYPTEFAEKKELIFGTLKIVPQKRTLVINEKELELTKTEFEILYLLASNQDKTFSREELLKLISDREYANFDRSIDMHISHLRSKLNTQNPVLFSIKTIWGSGYRFEAVDPKKK